MYKRIFRFELKFGSYWHFFFHGIAPNFVYSHKLFFFLKIIVSVRPAASTLELVWHDMLGMYFFIFASCEPLNKSYNNQEHKKLIQNKQEWYQQLFNV